jgi:hypothetical protein
MPREYLPIISYGRLIDVVNRCHQGIMPNLRIQEWYNRERERTGENPVCVWIGTNAHINPPDFDNRRLTTIESVNALTPRKMYVIVFFKGEEFEFRHRYEGVDPSRHIHFMTSRDSDCDSDSDCDNDSSSDSGLDIDWSDSD